MNEPLPVLVHEPVVAPPVIVPLSAACALLQITWSMPALTVGDGVI
jgi:hypothetical protein